MPRALFLGVLLALGCGGAAPRPETGADADNGGDDGPVRLRLRAPLGTRYRTTSHVRSVTAGTVSLSVATATMEVVRLDAGMGRTSVASRYDSMSLTDAAGVPLPGTERLDLTGIVYTFDLDDRCGVVGPIEMAGDTPENHAFADSLRTTLSGGFTRLPEAPVAPGDTWPDAVDVPIPLGAQTLHLHCEIENTLVSIDHSTGEALALVSATGECTMPPTSVEGAVAEVHATSSAENRIALSDGFGRSSDSHTDTSVRVTASNGVVLFDATMEQESHSVTTRE